MKTKIIIYTDGAARGNPGKAGWGVVIIFYPYPTSPLSRGRSKEGVFEMGGNSPHATNNVMELTAPIQALKHLRKRDMSKTPFDNTVEIFSDSKYVILGITEWIKNWMQNNWRNAAKKPVLNKELWQELYMLNQEFNPAWRYVKGHNGDKYNDRADEIATSFADGAPVDLKK